MVVNVSFPLKATFLEAQRQALAYISLELNKVVSGSLNTDHATKTQSTLDSSHEAHNNPAKAGIISGPNQQIVHNDWIRRVLFPLEEDGTLQTDLRTIPHRALFDPAINFEQAHAVNSVCINDYGVLPYLISGPPGTGKTKTLVETAMQLLNGDDVAHILICAPSEAAADTLALRLKHYLSNKQLFRLNRPGRADNEVPQELTQYCYMENDMFYLPHFQTFMAFNVIVTSCQDAALLADARLTNNDLWEVERNMLAAFHPEQEAEVPIPALHWGALLIDEAAQATEIDVLSAITVVCPPSSYPVSNHQPRFVMAGDENQLGPRTASRNPEFSKSLFARLFGRPLYADHPLSRSKIKPSSGPPVLKSSMLPITFPPFANLIRNYRSHPAILSVPSSLFYNDTLIPEAVTPNTTLQTSSLWRGRNWPVLFIPNTANDEIERDAGGWYNVTEARTACSLAQTLVYDCRVQQADICIMSPFAAQVKLLRSLIRSSDYGGGSGLWYVNIGPLEAFQGLEKRVVILCTTRTRSRFLVEDEKRGMGIVGQKRKMNVALTRAKEALFVIGNPEVLGRDEHWKVWLAFCWRNGLVSDRGEVWRGGEEGFGNEKVGVLERALVAKEAHGGQKASRVLGHAASSLDMERDYELWVESLREALDEELDAVEEDLEDDVDENLQDDADKASHETK
ncbi:P-loop containing nucleoside triphosphate hydrolase protein [Paraphoma chrysanthemicola]|nr:P-loop containing nucleoside triphosphate hydrolase protein [Paraphoma chrysanthemicola]